MLAQIAACYLLYISHVSLAERGKVLMVAAVGATLLAYLRDLLQNKGIKIEQEIIMMPIEFDMIVFEENESLVAYCPELDISSCGNTVEQAKTMLKTAVRLFIEEADKMGTLVDILEEANYKKDESGKWLPPRLVATELVSL